MFNSDYKLYIFFFYLCLGVCSLYLVANLGYINSFPIPFGVSSSSLEASLSQKLNLDT